MYSRLFCVLLLLALYACQNTGTEIERGLERQAQGINEALVLAREGVESLRDQMEAGLTSDSMEMVTADLGPEYKFFGGGVYYKDDDRKCGLWVSALTHVGLEVKQVIKKFEEFQKPLMDLVANNAVIELGHILTVDFIAMFYPHFDALSLIPPNTDFYEAYKPFAYVSPKLNPNKQTRWIDTYIDAVGNGYVCTVTTPFYRGTSFGGSVGCDITLTDVGELYLKDERLQMLIDANSLLLWASKEMVNTVPLNVLDPFYYTSPVVEDEYVSDQYRLENSEDEDIKTLGEAALNNRLFSLIISGKRYEGVSVAIPETQWRLVELYR